MELCVLRLRIGSGALVGTPAKVVRGSTVPRRAHEDTPHPPQEPLS